ncbi:hypothetical protein [Aeoliella sp. SH292]|uniref:hypothetical protein n=1 Tax=Aeoliella sp. SH292 TaxID=3454464 RepID=UPI003F9CE06C
MPIDALQFVRLPLAAAEVASASVYEFARVKSLGDEWWVLPALGLGLLALLAYVWWMYRRESRTISPTKAIVLGLLRTIAIAGLVMFFLDFEKRSSTDLVEPSRVVILADTSLSMNLPDAEPTSSDRATRGEKLQALIKDSPLIENLNRDHDVDIVAMGDTTRPLAYLPRKDETATEPAVEPEAEGTGDFSLPQLAEAMTPVGHETRIGDAIAASLERYQGLPLAGVVLLTDGGQNRGLELQAAAEAAIGAKVKVHSIGFGPTTTPANIVVRELIAPERAYPGDKLTVQVIVHVQHLAGQQFELQLSRRPAGDPNATPAAADWEVIDTRTLSIASDDALETVRIESDPPAPGEYVYEIRALPAPRETMIDDNAQQAEIAVIDRETRVLLFAGGPTRDYHFLRNQLKRDKGFVVDVLLASAGPGISQDANEILTEFPTTAEQLSKYDAIVAFDPDWSTLSAEQVRWLDQWVSRQAGGLIVIPGRVNTPRWGIDARMRTIRGLYPVRMPEQLLDLRSEESGDDVARPLRFTREGQEAEFLWLADNAAENAAEWEEFEGMFSALEHNGPKPGATVYAFLGDAAEAGAEAEAGTEYIVGHYYGAGQVLFIGSGELWRLRKLDPSFYDRLWTSLLRHTSQARLLQGSPRGKLLLAQDRYELGATVPVRAMLSDLQLEPLVAENVTLDIEMPGGRIDRLSLPADEARPGNFASEFRVVLPGTYRLTLAIPDSTDELSRTIRVTTPQLEVGQTTRNAEALEQLARATGGTYYPTPPLAIDGSETVESLAAATPSQSRSKRVIGAIDKTFARDQSFWLLALVAGALSLEWIIRRLSYLA